MRFRHFSDDPLQWSRGLLTAETYLLGYDSDPKTMLQWSRGLLTAETQRGQSVRVGERRASMEPRSFDRGDV